MLLLEWELYAGVYDIDWDQLLTLTDKQTVLLQHNWNSFKKKCFQKAVLKDFILGNSVVYGGKQVLFVHEQTFLHRFVV